MRGLLVAFEGLDQSGKQTQAERLRDEVIRAGRSVRIVSFPDYDTRIGAEIGAALQGQRDFGPDVMQLLYIANRYEWKPAMVAALEAGEVVICDRYMASSIAYGEAQGLDRAWLTDTQRFLPPADITILLDIAPATAVERKSTNRDRYERDLAMQTRVRASYQAQAAVQGWARLDGQRPKDEVAADVRAIVLPRLAAH